MRKDVAPKAAPEDEVLKAILGGDNPSALFGNILISRLEGLSQDVAAVNKKLDDGLTPLNQRVSNLEEWRKDEEKARSERRRFFERNETRYLAIASIIAVIFASVISGIFSAAPHLTVHFGK